MLIWMYKMGNITICAIIVTFNRKDLLLRCLDCVLKQKYELDAILIVDNASSDGSFEYLSKNNFLSNPKIKYIYLDKNTGGAGGFYHGMEYACKKGFDFVWLMDDDGYPDINCLFNQKKYLDENNCLGSIVLDEDNKDKLSFPIRIPNSIKTINELQDIKKFIVNTKVIADILIPFNGVLLSTKVINKIGLPCKDYFIWGDDMEYIYRLKSYGIKLFTITSAKFYHPKENKLGSKMFFNLLIFNDTDSQIKLYCMCRNNTVNLLKYFSILHFLSFFFKVIWFYTITTPNFKKLKLSLTAIYHGIRKDFSHHLDYLN